MIKEIPTSIKHMKLLGILLLNSNSFENLPVEIGQLTALNMLKLDWCQYLNPIHETSIYRGNTNQKAPAYISPFKPSPKPYLVVPFPEAPPTNLDFFLVGANGGKSNGYVSEGLMGQNKPQSKYAISLEQLCIELLREETKLYSVDKFLGKFSKQGLKSTKAEVQFVLASTIRNEDIGMMNYVKR